MFNGLIHNFGYVCLILIMKRFFILCCVILSAVATHAQQLHFAFLQTDTHKPFYVILNKRTYSSTASGYVILPKLQSGEFAVRIGFANSQGAEQEYVLQVKEADQGLLIKDFGDKGWGLFNMQTMAVQYAGTAAQERAKRAAAEKAEMDKATQRAEQEALALQAKRREDSVNTMIMLQKQSADSLSAVAIQNTLQQRYNDSVTMAGKMAAQQKINTDSVNRLAAIALQQKAIRDSVSNANAFALQKKNTADSITLVKAIAAENERLEKIADDAARAKEAAVEKDKKDLATAKEIHKEEVKQPDKISLPVDTDAQVQPPVLLQQTFTDSGWHYAYRVTNNKQRETVDVFIPAAQPKLAVALVLPAVEKDTVIKTVAQPADTVKTQHTVAPVVHDTVASVQEPVQEKIKNNPANIANKTDTKPIVSTDTIVPQVDKSIINANCKSVANENDFYNLRRKIASAIGSDQMLVAARKQLKDKCYTTEQIRNLCVLFLTDESRYRFLDAAYPFAFDAYHYHLLQDLLLDDYYIQRFKAMLR